MKSLTAAETAPKRRDFANTSNQTCMRTASVPWRTFGISVIPLELYPTEGTTLQPKQVSRDTNLQAVALLETPPTVS